MAMMLAEDMGVVGDDSVTIDDVKKYWLSNCFNCGFGSKMEGIKQVTRLLGPSLPNI